jgi:hypothetical protein
MRPSNLVCHGVRMTVVVVGAVPGETYVVVVGVGVT